MSFNRALTINIWKTANALQDVLNTVGRNFFQLNLVLVRLIEPASEESAEVPGIPAQRLEKFVFACLLSF